MAFNLRRLTYTSECYWCKKIMPIGSWAIRRAVKDVISNTPNPKTKDKDFHEECNTEFEKIYAPFRDAKYGATI